MALTLKRRQDLLATQSNSASFIQDGQRMARRDPQGIFDALKAKHTAETALFQAASQQLKAEGQALLSRREELAASLTAAAFDAGRHLREIAQAKIDLAWAVGLLILNGALALIVLLGFGPTWITCLLALLVLATALPVEEFFIAYDDKEPLREGLFLALSVLGLGATFWLGGLRGLFLGALTNADLGPANETLNQAARILQFGLAALAVVSEVLCGFKFYRWRKQWHSSTAHAVRERDACNHKLIKLAGAVKAAEVEPDVRREYRTIGAKQELALQASSQSRHLQQAFLGALIALVFLVALFLLVPIAAAESVAPRPVVVLLDLTISTQPESFAQNVRAVRAVIPKLVSGQRLLVLGIADSFGHSGVIFDRQLPQTRSYLGLELRAAQERMMIDWDNASRRLERRYKQTDIVGALFFLSHLGDVTKQPICLIVFSDLRQSVSLDLERPAAINAKLLIEKARHHPGIPQLPRAEVHLLGVDPFDKTPGYFRDLREFWVEFFSAAGASVQTFNVDRHLPDLGQRIR
jgi:hypothetical protein